ncbi:branched-chain amino acid ABC transporter permease [Desulfovibrio ferrophilus]|uniref:LivM4 protein n=1 Tax=Desulfovibrio ferrophilus TaxID=241368 RepID=A0A2Z6B0X4_9BACT|nr:branched-chain amino acid ABC transporter permease [Desulfovibrio ferrophilus]BBD09098.1 LivM4 protein [Desulfovibrio ferrophilus]
MEDNTITSQKKGPIRRFFTGVPMLAWLLGGLICVLLERSFGLGLANAMGLHKIPVLFGINTTFKVIASIIESMRGGDAFMARELLNIPSAFIYVLCIFAIPMALFFKVAGSACNGISRAMSHMPLIVTAAVHLAIMFAVFHFWASMSDYRLITLKLMLIAILFTLSLNIINGYMGEFSCSHPGFMALGAYGASLFSVGLFVDDKVLGSPVFEWAQAYLTFPLALIFGGLMASLWALIIAIPSFKTRGDYLAIISLAFLFIVKSFFENVQALGGPRGLSSQPDWATLPVVFLVVVAGVWIINNFVTSTMGKALNAVRDDESAAEAMTVNTRTTKMSAFLFGAFWAGVAGGLFAHVLRYVNPAMFGVQKLAEVLAMVYFGGLNSVTGSIIGAVSISVLGEALRPLGIFKWICIPLLLILVMIYRPTGLFAFRDFNIRSMFGPREEK